MKLWSINICFWQKVPAYSPPPPQPSLMLCWELFNLEKVWEDMRGKRSTCCCSNPVGEVTIWKAAKRQNAGLVWENDEVQMVQTKELHAGLANTGSLAYRYTCRSMHSHSQSTDTDWVTVTHILSYTRYGHWLNKCHPIMTVIWQ